jgi:hypothetical protein
MAAVHALSQAFGAETESLKIVAIFSGLGLLISLLCVLYFLAQDSSDPLLVKNLRSPE